MTRPNILPLIAAEVDHPCLKHLVDDPLTTLAQLRIDGPARVHLAMQIEDLAGVHLSDCAVQAWGTVGDVLGCLKEMERG